MIQDNEEIGRQKALIDSGAMDNFFDPQTSQKWNLQTRKMKYPRQLVNIDGSPNKGGRMEEYCILNMKHGKKEIPQIFYIAEIGGDRMILGYPWLEAFDPWIKWSTKWIYGPEIELQLGPT